MLDRMPEQRLKIVPDVVLTAGISGEQRLQQNQECQVLKELPEILQKVMTYEDQAAKLCMSTSPPQDQQLEVSSGDMNPCSSVLLDRATKKQEVFAKSKRIPLTVNTFTDEYLILFSELQVKPQVVVLPSIVSPWSNHNLHKTTRMRLGFPPPLSDFLSFSKQLQDNMVVLETCSITEHTLIGTVLVKNITYEKDVRLRITFDSWRSHHNVPCVYTEQSYEYPGTNTFSFNIPVPKNLEPHDRIEFCVSYQPGGYLTPLWDNNRGQNYCVILDPSGVQSMPHRERCSKFNTEG